MRGKVVVTEQRELDGGRSHHHGGGEGVGEGVGGHHRHVWWMRLWFPKIHGGRSRKDELIENQNAVGELMMMTTTRE